jgi:peptidoglycan/xylan/chitin deacetylase (PgdA/CDA1 family)
MTGVPAIPIHANNPLSTRSGGNRIPILMYHDIRADGGERIGPLMTNPAYVLAEGQFAAQVKYLHEKGYKSVSLAQLIDQDKSLEKNSVVLTFDDGWASNYSLAMPMLREYGLAATVFVVSDFVDTQQYMSWQQLKEMGEAGFSIQSHTAGHRALSVLKDSEIKDELGKSKAVLEDKLGSMVEFLSTPHGMIDERVVQIAHSTGYKGICTSEPGYRHRLGRPAVLHRINVSGKYDLESFGRILRGDPGVFIPLILSKKVKSLSKRLLGYKTYRAIYDLRYRRQH